MQLRTNIVQIFEGFKYFKVWLTLILKKNCIEMVLFCCAFRPLGKGCFLNISTYIYVKLSIADNTCGNTF